MANEITAQFTLSYTNTPAGIPQQTIQLPAKTFNISGVNYNGISFTVPTTAGGTLIPQGGLQSRGFAGFLNVGTSVVEILTAVSGTVIIAMNPGEPALFRFGSGMTAPAALAISSPG